MKRRVVHFRWSCSRRLRVAITASADNSRHAAHAGLAAAGAAGLLGGHMSFRLAGRANQAEPVPHLVEPGWHDLMRLPELPDRRPVRRMLGEVAVLAVRDGDRLHVLADRCSHRSGPLSDGSLDDGFLTCPWHNSTFRVADGSVVHGPATAPQPVFQTRIAGDVVQVCLPGQAETREGQPTGLGPARHQAAGWSRTLVQPSSRRSNLA